MANGAFERIADILSELSGIKSFSFQKNSLKHISIGRTEKKIREVLIKLYYRQVECFYEIREDKR